MKNLKKYVENQIKKEIAEAAGEKQINIDDIEHIGNTDGKMNIKYHNTRTKEELGHTSKYKESVYYNN